MSLTRKQYQIFCYINNYINEHGIAPTYQEICTEMHIKSLSGAHRFVVELKERGYILHNAKKSRAISILKSPETQSSEKQQQPSPTSLTSKPSQTSFDKATTEDFVFGPSKMITIPLYGFIAAGPSIEAIRDQSSFIDLPASMLGKGNYYALRVSGDSMSGAAIVSGDVAIIHQQNHAQNGDIVVALTQEDHVTLKYFYAIDDLVHLKPANPQYTTLSIPPEQVRIQGKLTNILRNY